MSQLLSKIAAAAESAKVNHEGKAIVTQSEDEGAEYFEFFLCDLILALRLPGNLTRWFLLQNSQNAVGATGRSPGDR